MSDVQKEQAIKQMTTKLNNLGPVSCRWLYEAGITSAEEFFDIKDPKKVFWKLFQTHGPKIVNANLMYSIDAALCGETWSSLPQEKKDHWKKFLIEIRKSI